MTFPRSCRAPQLFSHSFLNYKLSHSSLSSTPLGIIFLIQEAGLIPFPHIALCTETLVTPIAYRIETKLHNMVPGPPCPTPAYLSSPTTCTCHWESPRCQTPTGYWGHKDTQDWHKDEQDLAYTLKKPEVLLGRQTQRGIVGERARLAPGGSRE